MENVENLEFDPKIDYNVYNALNLLNEELGKSYASSGFNPFGENFCLEEDYIKNYLSSKSKAFEIESPEFINNGEKQTAIAFNNAKNNSKTLISMLSELLTKSNLNETDIKKLKFYIAQLKCFNQLLIIFIEKIKKEKNLLEMYKQALAINWELASLLKQTFEKEYNSQQALDNFIFFITNKTTQTEKEDNILKEQAKQIIENNLKRQEQLSKITETISKQEKIENKQTDSVKEQTIKKPPVKKVATKTTSQQKTSETEEQIER